MGTFHVARYNLFDVKGISQTVEPDFKRIPAFGDIRLAIEVLIDGTPTDTFTATLQARFRDTEGNKEVLIPEQDIWTNDYTGKSQADSILISNSVFNEWRLVITKTGTTDHANVKATLLQLFEKGTAWAS